MEERLAKERHMICLHIESTSRPGIGFADAADFLFDKWSKFTPQNLFPIVRTPDKVIGQLIGDVFGVLCINLITCAGDWIASQHQTKLRLVVYTALV